MKTYNKEVLEKNKQIMQSTRNLSKKTVETSKRTVEKLTNPSSKVKRIGIAIGSIMGIILVVTGVAGFITGNRIWAFGLTLAGFITILSNIVNLSAVEKSNNMERRNM